MRPGMGCFGDPDDVGASLPWSRIAALAGGSRQPKPRHTYMLSHSPAASPMPVPIPDPARWSKACACRKCSNAPVSDHLYRSCPVLRSLSRLGAFIRTEESQRDGGGAPSGQANPLWTKFKALYLRRRFLVTTSLTVQMLVPLPAPLGPPLVFHRWLPTRKDALAATCDGYSLSIWWDIDCLAFMAPPSIDDLDRVTNVLTEKVHVAVDLPDLSTELADYIHSRGLTQNFQGSAELSQDFRALAESVFRAVVQALNRFIAIVRALRGQYFAIPLQEDPGDPASFFVATRALVSSADFSPVRWHPPLDHRITLTMQSEDCFICREDWGHIHRLLASTEAVPLPRELITYAEQLSHEGHTRAAIVQGISALEIAIDRFLGDPDQVAALARGRRLHNLSHLKEKLGLRGTLGTLFPLLFSEGQLSEELLEELLKAVDARGTVVHRAQMKLDRQKLYGHLHAIRQVIEKLDCLPGPPSGPRRDSPAAESGTG